jgi:hypothetical protein
VLRAWCGYLRGYRTRCLELFLIFFIASLARALAPARAWAAPPAAAPRRCIYGAPRVHGAAATAPIAAAAPPQRQPRPPAVARGCKPRDSV